MATQRTHIVLPAELIKEIDALVGPRGRSAFIAETARKELRKRRLLEFLSRDEPAWKDEDHPEWPNGDSDAWVRSLRGQSSDRTRAIEAKFAEGEDKEQ
jgi:hypothetical protein